MCNELGLTPYYCFIQILQNDLNVFLFSSENERRIKNDNKGVNLRINKNDIEENRCQFDGVLWRYKINWEIFVKDKLVQNRMKLVYSEEKEFKHNIGMKKEHEIKEIDKKSYSELVKQISIINSLENLSKTEKEQLVKTRIGQSELKELLVKKNVNAEYVD